ncbi:WD repeat-containing protein 5B [Manis javanica]|nr:WD repeat-containing protein 5B [Manis javanica]
MRSSACFGSWHGTEQHPKKLREAAGRSRLSLLAPQNKDKGAGLHFPANCVCTCTLTWRNPDFSLEDKLKEGRNSAFSPTIYSAPGVCLAQCPQLGETDSTSGCEGSPSGPWLSPVHAGALYRVFIPRSHQLSASLRSGIHRGS